MIEFLKKHRNEITFEKVVVRLIMAWLLTTVLFYMKSDGVFATAAYAAGINIMMYICYVILFFVFFCALGFFKPFTWVETYGPMILITLYGFLTVKSNSNIGYISGIIIVLAVAVVYAVNKTTAFVDINRKRTIGFINLAAMLFYLFVAGGITVLRYLTYSSPAYDFGIWVQMFHNMRETFQPVTTVERAKLLSHFAVHFSPVYYIYLPFYAIFPYAVTLQILQVVTIASGMIPVYLLCKKKELSKTATAAFAIIFALFPSLACGCFYDLHENCFLVPFLLWMFYFIEKDDMKGIAVFAILTMLVKEDAPVYVACIGLYIILGKRKYIKGSIITALAIAYFLIVTLMMKKYGLGVMTYRYDNYINGTEGGLMDVIRNFITNPVYVISECFSAKKIEFMLYMFLPLGFLPLISKRVPNLILLLPVILINLASNYQYQYSIFFQYTFGTAAILMYLAIINYAELGEKVRRALCSLAICAAIILMPLCALSRTYYFDKYENNKAQQNLLNTAVESIPEDSSVITTAFLLPHLAQREVIYEYTTRTNISFIEEKQTDYIMLDMRYGEYSDEVITQIENIGYVVEDDIPNLYIILKKE